MVVVILFPNFLLGSGFIGRLFVVQLDGGRTGWRNNLHLLVIPVQSFKLCISVSLGVLRLVLFPLIAHNQSGSPNTIAGRKNRVAGKMCLTMESVNIQVTGCLPFFPVKIDFCSIAQLLTQKVVRAATIGTSIN